MMYHPSNFRSNEEDVREYLLEPSDVDRVFNLRRLELCVRCKAKTINKNTKG